MTSPFLKSVLVTLVTLATVASPLPAHAAITLESVQRALDTPAVGVVQDQTDGSFSQTIGVVGSGTNGASQNSLIDLAALPQFSGTGAASINLPGSAGQLEAQSYFFVEFTIPVGESYTYALSGNLASAGTGYIDATGFRLVEFIAPNTFNSIHQHDAPSAFTHNGLLDAGTYHVSMQTRLLQEFEENASATGSWELAMTLRPVTSGAVPEPSSLTLFGLGLFGWCAARMRRRGR